MSENNKTTEVGGDSPETVMPSNVSDSNWITLKVARSDIGCGKTTIRNWIQTGELPSRQENGICMVPQDRLMALHKSKPHPSAKKSECSLKPHTDVDAQMAVRTQPTAGLRTHPLNAEIYGTQHDARLLESVQNNGIMCPLLITTDGLVVSGGERLWAAKESGIAEVPVCILDTADETEIKLKVLESNIAREKTNEQRIREYKAFKAIETEKAQTRQGMRTDLVQTFTPGESGKARDLAAAKVGWSGLTAEKGSQVLYAIEERSKTENMQIVEEVRYALNQASVDAAYKQVVALGWFGTSSANRDKGTRTPARVIQKAFTQTKTAASKLVELIKAEEISLFTPVQIQDLRQALEPLLKWIDGLEPREQKPESI